MPPTARMPRVMKIIASIKYLAQGGSVKNLGHLMFSIV